MAVITVADYKAWIGETGSAYDTVLGVVIPAVEADLETACGRVFKSATYTDEVYNGKGEDSIWLRNYPVDSVAAVKVLDSNGNTETLASSEYRLVAPRRVVRLSDADAAWDHLSRSQHMLGRHQAPVFPWAQGNILVTYTGGYATIPDDLKYVMYRLVDAALDLRGENWALAQATDGIEARTFLTGRAYAEAKRELIRPWVREAN